MSSAAEEKSGGVTVYKREPIVVQDAIPVLDTGRFEQMQRIASAMATCSLMPKALYGQSEHQARANCFLVVNQAVRWGMDPFALAQHTYEVSGKLGYEGKVIAALINSSPRVQGSLKYAYDGEGDGRTITVSGVLAGEDEPRTVSGSVAEWKTQNTQWKSQPDQMLAYRGAREWARRHMPEEMLGVYSEDELYEMALVANGPKTLQRPEREDYREPDKAVKQEERPAIDVPVDDEPEPETAATDEDDGPVEGEVEPVTFIDQFGEIDEEPLDGIMFVAKLCAAMDECSSGGAIKALLDHNADAIASLPADLSDQVEAHKAYTRDRLQKLIEAEKAKPAGKPNNTESEERPAGGTADTSTKDASSAKDEPQPPAGDFFVEPARGANGNIIDRGSQTKILKVINKAPDAATVDAILEANADWLKDLPKVYRDGITKRAETVKKAFAK